MFELIEDCKNVGGKFEIKETQKGFKISMIEKPIFMLGASDNAFNNKTKSVQWTNGKRTQHAVKLKSDDEYLIYFYQSGVPCRFRRLIC